MVVHSLLGAGAGLVDVGAGDGRARRVGVRAADGVVEEEDPLGAWDVFEEQSLDFGVVVFFDGRVGDEGLFGAWGLVLEHAEAGCVDVVGRFVAADVVYCYAVTVFGVVTLGLAGWGLFDIVEGGGAVGRGRVEG